MTARRSPVRQAARFNHVGLSLDRITPSTIAVGCRPVPLTGTVPHGFVGCANFTNRQDRTSAFQQQHACENDACRYAEALITPFR